MRIAVLTKNFSGTGGGAERYAIALVEQLAGQHEVHVFAQTIAHAFPGVNYHTVPAPFQRPRWANQLWFALLTWWATRKGFDVVHSHENTWHGNVQTVHVLPVKHNLFNGKAGWARALRWVKVVTSPRLLVYLWLEKMRYRVTSGRQIVLASETLQKIMQTAYPSAQAAMKVIAPGIAMAPGRCSDFEQKQARTALNLPANGHCILFVGNDFRKKGLPALLQSLAQHPDDVFLAVVGKGEQGDTVRKLMKELNLSARVHFVGALQDMETAYQAADCLVHPTLEDTYAMVVLEAMAHGLPVIVSGASYCGIAAELRNGVDAVILPDPRDVLQLAVELRALFTNPARTEALSREALEFARSRTWQRAALAYECVYAAVLENK